MERWPESALAPEVRVRLPPVPPEELLPADINTAPPSPTVEEPTSNDKLPAALPMVSPVDTTTEPEGPPEALPLPISRAPLVPLLEGPLLT
jgi:hypothetical protein